MHTLHNVIASTVERMKEGNMGRIEMTERSRMDLFIKKFSGEFYVAELVNNGVAEFVDYDTRCAYVGFCAGMEWEKIV